MWTGSCIAYDFVTYKSIVYFESEQLKLHKMHNKYLTIRCTLAIFFSGDASFLCTSNYSNCREVLLQTIHTETLHCDCAGSFHPSTDLISSIYSCLFPGAVLIQLMTELATKCA